MERKILFLADFSSIHIYNYFKEVKKLQSFDIVGITPCNKKIRSEYLDFYKSLNIKIIYGLFDGKKSVVSRIASLFFLLKHIGTFDVVHIHYLKFEYVLPLICMRKKIKKIIISFWGSDLFRSSKRQFFFINHLLAVADEITFITEDMRSYYIQNYLVDKDILNKISIRDFGNSFYEAIDSKMKECDLNVKKKINVTIGYCGRPEMQQFLVVQILAELPLCLRDKIRVLIPAWGINPSLLKKIEDLLLNSKMDYEIFDYFMGPDEVAALRCNTSIFINAQKTDALSNAMLEHIYAGSVVVNGGWLKYSLLEKCGIFYCGFDSFKDLLYVIPQIIDDFNTYRKKSLHNRLKIKAKTSWNYWVPLWEKLYN